MNMRSRLSRLEQALKDTDPELCCCEHPYHYEEIVGEVPSHITPMKPTCPKCGRKPRSTSRVMYKRVTKVIHFEEPTWYKSVEAARAEYAASRK